MTDLPNPVRSERLVWADVAKGIAILLVVLLHVHTKHVIHLDWSVPAGIERMWSTFHIVFAPLRIPLFFVISGMFASRALHRPWREVMSKRVANPYYLYVVWLLLHAGFYGLLGSGIDGLLVTDGRLLAARLLVPTSSLWYVFALALFFPLAKVLVRWPPWVGLSAASALALAAPAASRLLPTDLVAVSIPANFPYFLLGALLPHVIRTMADRASGAQVAVAGTLYAGVVTAYLLGYHQRFGVRLVAGYIALWFGVVIAVQATRSPFLARVGSYFGRNTLPIFLLHMPLIAAVRWLAEGRAQHLWERWVLPHSLLASLYPVALTALIVTACMAGHRVLKTPALRWSLALPARAASRLTAGSSARSSG